MSDDARDEVQRNFRAPPDQHPVRILLATDAAREGVNLQAYCADLFHFDVPWNPARLEQRNGRIDRTMQPADEVRCHYFVLAARKEDRVLETLVRKIDIVARELGSVGAVLMDEIEHSFDAGITDTTAERIEVQRESILHHVSRLVAHQTHAFATNAAFDLEHHLAFKPRQPRVGEVERKRDTRRLRRAEPLVGNPAMHGQINAAALQLGVEIAQAFFEPCAGQRQFQVLKWTLQQFILRQSSTIRCLSAVS
jgi:hypothetical protein